MALRNIREMGDEILSKKAKAVKEMTPRIETLIEDMLDTMYEAQGVGLAAPQVGILKRIVVIDVDPGEEPNPIVLINPEILETSGEQRGYEGCLLLGSCIHQLLCCKGSAKYQYPEASCIPWLRCRLFVPA